MQLRISGILGLGMKRMTSLCLTKGDISRKSYVSALAGCLLFLRSEWVPCSAGAQFCEVRPAKIFDAAAANVFCIFVLRFVLFW